MDKSKLIVSDKYQTTHGCKGFTSNDDSNVSMDEICQVMDILLEGDNFHDVQHYGQELHERKQWEMVRGTNFKLYLIISYFNIR